MVVMAAQRIRIDVPGFPPSIASGFVGQHDAACGHHHFDVPVAETEANVASGTMADDRCRETMALVEIACG